MIVVVCPGQGSQTPGLLAPWIEDPAPAQLLDAFGAAAGVDLVRHGTTSDADTIRDTAVAQPLIVAAGLLTWDALRTAVGDEAMRAVDGVAGHSVGEFTATAIAGILPETDAVRLVGIRGRAMAAAAARTSTGMSAVIGAAEPDLDATLAQFGLAAANYNGGGQTVVAGTTEALAALQAEPPARARVISLAVAGAFHTAHMASARDDLAAVAATLQPNAPRLRMWTNRDGTVLTDGATAVSTLVEQVTRPVRWDLCMDAFGAAGVTGIIELAPGGTLIGLAKRVLKGVPTVAITTPDDIPAAAALLTTAVTELRAGE